VEIGPGAGQPKSWTEHFPEEDRGAHRSSARPPRRLSNGKVRVHHQSPHPPNKLREWCEREYGSYRAGLVTLSIAGTGLIGFVAVGVIAAFSALS
jgi:hypothetical protein